MANVQHLTASCEAPTISQQEELKADVQHLATNCEEQTLSRKEELKSSPFAILPTDLGACVCEFLLIQEACNIMHTSVKFKQYILTSFGREHACGVVRWQHVCPGEAYVAEYANRVGILQRVCAACPRIAMLFCEDDRSKATCDCKPRPRKRLFVTSPGHDVNLRPVIAVDTDALRRSASYKYLTNIRLVMRPGEADLDSLKLRECFPKLKIANVFIQGIVGPGHSDSFGRLLRSMGQNLEEIRWTFLQAEVSCWQSAFAEPLAEWTRLRYITLHLHVRESWATSGSNFQALLDLPRFLPKRLKHIHMCIQRKFSDESFAKFASALSNRLESRFPAWKAASRFSNWEGCEEVHEFVFTKLRILKGFSPKSKWKIQEQILGVLG